MRRFAFAVALFAFACHTTAQQPAQKQKSDLELIQGTWRIDRLESGGKAQSGKALNGYNFTFGKVNGGNIATLREGPFYQQIEFELALDPTQSPKAIDLSTKSTKALGIYKLEGDDLLTICVGLSGSRPAEFATQAGGDTEIFTLKRNRWQPHNDKGLGFSIDFPGRPTESKREFGTGAGKVAATVLSLQSEIEQLHYTVTVVPLSKKVDGNDAEAAIDSVLKAMVDDIDPMAKARAESEPRIGKAPAGVMASREFTITSRPPEARESTTTRVRVYVAGERLFALAVSGSEAATRPPNVTPFWNSFRTPADKRKDPPGKF
jgi:uncharacterized protein (TIGR03067 family)